MKDRPELISSIKLIRQLTQYMTENPRPDNPMYAAWSDQICRAAISVPANVPEATGRITLNMQVQYYRVARGSLFEVIGLLLVWPDTPKTLLDLARQVLAEIDATLGKLAEEKLAA